VLRLSLQSRSCWRGAGRATRLNVSASRCGTEETLSGAPTRPKRLSRTKREAPPHVRSAEELSLISSVNTR
jgi:hypothetical protein